MIPGLTAPTRIERIPNLREQASLGSKIYTLMIMDSLAFVVVFGAQQTRASGDGLRRFISLEPLEQCLFPFSIHTVAQPSVTKHSRVVHLEIFRVDLAHMI